MAFFQAFMRKVFEKKMGEFLRVEEGNYQCSASSVRLRQAEIKEEVFDELHLPVTLRGGFIEEMSVTFPGMFGSGSAEVVIKNVFLVFGPHSTDWSWDHVYKCKSRLIDLVMKIYELKPRKKKKAGGGAAKGGYFADLQKRMISDMKRTFLSMLKVHISNIHFRYEDSITQSMPLACGFKIGYIGVSSKEETDDRRTTGEWKHWRERYANPEFCQAIACRRISAYWDLGQQAEDCGLFALGPIAGQDVRRNFTRLNLRETFSACVVEKVLELFPPERKRRKYLHGPIFRERLDFHRYVVFPASLRAEVTGNEASEATRAQKAPMKDLDVIVDPLEAAVDSEQVRSMNQLLVFVQEFTRKDNLLRTRPHEPISKYLASTTPRSSSLLRSEVTGGADRSTVVRSSSFHMGGGSRSSVAARPTNGQRKASIAGPDDAAKKALVRAWWHHAFQGVRYLCRIPRSPVSKQELLERTHLRESFISLCMEIVEAEEREKAELDAPRISEGLREKIQNMQMRLAPRDILEWRMMARERRGEHLGKLEEEAKEELEQQASEKPPPNMPSTIQACIHFTAMKAHFLGVADHLWNDIAGPLGNNLCRTNSNCSKNPSTASSSNRRRPRMTRQLVVKGQVLDVRIEVVQKGRSGHRVARWLELGVGSISADNCNVEGPDHSARQILNILPVEQLSTGGGPPVCAFVGVGSLQCLDRNLEPGDVPLGAVLQPWEGLANHLREFPQEDTPEQIKRLGFLKDYKDELGKLMTFVFVRVGQVRALDYTPFRRRVMHFMTRGRGSTTTDLVRRPSPLALNRELLAKLQRKVEKLTGKSDMLGIVEGVVDGVRGRMVDHYNAQHVLCKEVSLAPMTWKALRNGKPQAFHLQFHQLQNSGQRLLQPVMPSLFASQGDSWGLLPWKVSMLLLPKANFNMGLNITAEPAKPPVAVAEREKSQPTIADPVAVVLEGSNFLKWGRNGKSKKRFVYYDEDIEAIVWKNEENDKQLIGAIPLSKIQDVCTGLQTPVLQRVRSSKLCADRVLSIVAVERTLDLQAETVDHQQRWVGGLKARYKQHIQQQSLDGDTSVKLPKALERRCKVYPDTFRSDRCTLKSTYKKLQAVSALGKGLLTSSQSPYSSERGGSRQSP